jgi:hypothetical protein
MHKNCIVRYTFSLETGRFLIRIVPFNKLLQLVTVGIFHTLICYRYFSHAFVYVLQQMGMWDKFTFTPKESCRLKSSIPANISVRAYRTTASALCHSQNVAVLTSPSQHFPSSPNLSLSFTRQRYIYITCYLHTFPSLS